MADEKFRSRLTDVKVAFIIDATLDHAFAVE
jgi:hypothetical protein